MKRNCREFDPRMETLDARWKHPFTCVIVGPSGSGKSTFIRQLMLSQEKIIDAQFDYIYIFIGTDASENKILSCLLTDIAPSMTDVKIIEIMNIFLMKKQMVLEFPTWLKQMLISQNKKGRKGCIIFDNLMRELGEMGILLDLFTKMSSYYNTPVIDIPHNLFHKGSGKHSSDYIGVYRNSHITVLFNNLLDNHPLWTIAVRLVTKGSGTLSRMLEEIVEEHRNVVIHGGLDWPKKLHFMIDLFGKTGGVERQIVNEMLSD